MKAPRKKKQPPDMTAEKTSPRQHLLEIAGHVFAERGFDGTTSKEITERAGMNTAAVNYHFDGIVGLYDAVLKEASGLLTSSDAMQTAVAAQNDTRSKLEAFLGPFVKGLTSPVSESWKLRIIVREFTAPTQSDQSKRTGNERRKKMAILKGIVSERMGLVDDDPVVARTCLTILSPCFMLLMCDRSTLKKSFPKMGLKPDDAPALLDHMVRFALAGIEAVAD